MRWCWGLVCFFCIQAVFAQDILQVYGEALSQSPRITLFEARAQAAEGGVRQARAGLLPNISAVADASYNRLNSQHYYSDDLAVSLHQPLFDADKWTTYFGYRAKAVVASARLRGAQQALRYATVARYVAVLVAQSLVSVSQHQVSLLTRLNDDVKAKYDAGIKTITDYRQTAANVKLAKADVIQHQEALAIARSDLRVLTNQDMSDIDDLSDAAFTHYNKLAGDMDSWVSRALEDSPALAALVAAERARYDHLWGARFRHLPVVSLTGTWRHRNNNVAGVLGNNGHLTDKSVALTGTWKIFSSGEQFASDQVAAGEYDAAAAKTEGERRRLRRLVKDDYRAIIKQVNQIKAYQLGLQAADSAYREYLARYNVGVDSVVDVLRVSTDRYQARLKYRQARYQLILDVMKLRLDAGVITDADIAQLNQFTYRGKE